VIEGKRAFFNFVTLMYEDEITADGHNFLLPQFLLFDYVSICGNVSFAVECVYCALLGGILVYSFVHSIQ